MDWPSSVKTRLMPALRPTMPNEYFFAVMVVASGQLDLDVDASRELELHQRVHGLVVGVDDVEHALVRAGLVLVARVLVDVRRDEDGVAFDLASAAGSGRALARRSAWPFRRSRWPNDRSDDDRTP